MREPDIFFDDSEFKLSLFDDDWFEKKEKQTFGDSKLSAVEVNDDLGKAGLGFSKGKTSKRTNTTVALVDRLQNSKKRKNFSESLNDNAHQIIEDFELSRTSIGKTKSQAISNNKTSTNDVHINKTISNNNDHKNSHKNVSTTSHNTLDKPQLKTAAYNNDGITSVNTNNSMPNSSNLRISPSSTLTSNPKKKKRSKQKNIRKDTRPDELKPEHLRPGKDYCGRTLTEETVRKLREQRLGNKSSSDNTSNKSSNNSNNNSSSNFKKRDVQQESAESNNSNAARSQPRPQSAPGNSTTQSTAAADACAAAVDHGVSVSWSLDYSKT